MIALLQIIESMPRTHTQGKKPCTARAWSAFSRRCMTNLMPPCCWPYGWDDLASTLRQAQGERGQAQGERGQAQRPTDTLTRLVALNAQRAVEEKGRPHPLAAARVSKPKQTITGKRKVELVKIAIHQSTASSPLRSSKLSSFSDGPLGCFSPPSHFRTVDRLVFNTAASTAWLSCR